MTHNIGIVPDLNDIFGPSFVAAVSPAFLFGVRLLFPLQVVQVRIYVSLLIRLQPRP